MHLANCRQCPVSTYQVSSVQLVTDKTTATHSTTATPSRVTWLCSVLTDLPPSGSSIDPTNVAV